MEHLFLFCIAFYAFLSLLSYKKLRGKLYIAPVVPLAVASGQAIYQLFQGQKQRREADKVQGYVPPSLVEEENLARTQAGATQYAGQAEDESRVRQGVADTFANVSRASTSSGDVLNAASKLHGAQSDAMQGIAKTGQIFRQSALDRLRGAQARKAGAQMQSRMYAENLRGAAARNEYNAINSLAGGVVQAGMTNDWNKTFGKNTNPMMSMMGMMGGGTFNPMMMGMGGMNPNSFSAMGWNPMAFSAGFNNR